MERKTVAKKEKRKERRDKEGEREKKRSQPVFLLSSPLKKPQQGAPINEADHCGDPPLVLAAGNGENEQEGEEGRKRETQREKSVF